MASNDISSPQWLSNDNAHYLYPMLARGLRLISFGLLAALMLIFPVVVSFHSFIHSSLTTNDTKKTKNHHELITFTHESSHQFSIWDSPVLIVILAHLAKCNANGGKCNTQYYNEKYTNETTVWVIHHTSAVLPRAVDSSTSVLTSLTYMSPRSEALVGVSESGTDAAEEDISFAGAVAFSAADRA